MALTRQKILIVDRNRATLNQLANNLNRLGYEVITAEAGLQALEIANSEKPDLILADLQLSDMDGMELCWMVRETSEIPCVPFVLMSDTDDPEVRINGFRSGADAFLNKPVTTRELITRIETLLKRVDQIKASCSPSPKSFSGKLPDFSLIELLQFLNMTKKSGTLTLTKNQNKGQIGFLDGNIVWAEQADAEGEDAIHQMALWGQGNFEFEKDLIFTKLNIKRPAMQVILDCCAWIDEHI